MNKSVTEMTNLELRRLDTNAPAFIKLWAVYEAEKRLRELAFRYGHKP